MSLATLYGETQDTYLTLIRRCPLRPLRSEADLDEAMATMDALVIKDTLSAAEADYLAVLSDLVEQYEAEAHPMAPASDAELLQHLLEAQAITPVEVGQATGIDTATLTAVLAGHQHLTREQVGTLARYFHVSPSVFTFGE
jgi:HTH-type transcriptional regulator/antitoxin HigA